VATERDPGEVDDALLLLRLPFTLRLANAGAGPMTERSTSVFTMPWCATSEEMPLSSPKASRGTPRPAESLRKVKVPGAETLEIASGRVFTGTIAGEPPRGGGGAVTNERPPALAGVRAVTFCSPVNWPPGIQPQPAPPQLTQLPEWKGSQPHGYGETQE
jgi:hypothetical protein